MNKYSNQIYFNLLCDEYCMVYDEFKRLDVERSSFLGIFSKEYKMWNERLNDIKERISAFLKETKNTEGTIIYNKEEQTKVLIQFFAVNPNEYFSIINLEKEFEDHLPKDELSRKFIEMYKTKNRNGIVDLYQQIL